MTDIYKIKDERLTRLASDAILVQDACNLSGVVHSFSRALTSLREILREHSLESTDNINRHPITILYASKLASLSGLDNDGEFAKSYSWACSVA